MRGQRAVPKRKLARGTGPGQGVEAKGLPRCRRRGRCGEKVAENLVPGSPPEVPPARAQAGPGSLQPAPLMRTSAPRRCSGAHPLATKSPQFLQGDASPVAVPYVSGGDGGA